MKFRSFSTRGFADVERFTVAGVDDGAFVDECGIQFEVSKYNYYIKMLSTTLAHPLELVTKE